MRIEYGIVRRGPGRPCSASKYSVHDWIPVRCQRIFLSSHRSKYFAVFSSAETKSRKRSEPQAQSPESECAGTSRRATPDLVRDEIFQRLAHNRERDETVSNVIAREFDKTEVSSWLELLYNSA